MVSITQLFAITIFLSLLQCGLISDSVRFETKVGATEQIEQKCAPTRERKICGLRAEGIGRMRREMGGKNGKNPVRIGGKHL